MATKTATSVVDGVFTVVDATNLVLPVVFDSPHSGTIFPADFQSSVSPEVLMQAADLYVEELYETAPKQGAVLLNAHFPRIYVDANRPLSDLGPALKSCAETGGADAKRKSNRGIGLIWTVAPDESQIYDQPLTDVQMRDRVEKYWAPYHSMLESLLANRRKAFDAVWHVNCHSMPGKGTKLMGDFGNSRPDIIIGNRNGETCSPEFAILIVDFFRSRGFDTRINELFKGAEIVRRSGDPANNRHSVQIEINKSLYMNEESFKRLESFGEFRDGVIVPLIDEICAYAAGQMPGSSQTKFGKAL